MTFSRVCLKINRQLRELLPDCDRSVAPTELFNNNVFLKRDISLYQSSLQSGDLDPNGREMRNVLLGKRRKGGGGGSSGGKTVSVGVRLDERCICLKLVQVVLSMLLEVSV